MLEPFRYPTDVLSVLTGQTITNPFADAVEPAITMLGNLGYTNVVQYGDDPNDFRDDYQRDFSNDFGSNGGEAMPFFSFPQNIDWGAVPADFVTALSGGTRDAFFYGGIPGLNNPPPTQHENPVGLFVDLLKDAVGSSSLTAPAAVTPLAANAGPDQNAERIAVNADAAASSPAPPPSGTTDRQRPRLGIWRGSMKPPTTSNRSSTTHVASPGKSPLRQTISNTRQQIRDSVSDFAKRVEKVTKHVAKAAAGGGADGDGNDAHGE